MLKNGIHATSFVRAALVIGAITCITSACSGSGDRTAGDGKDNGAYATLSGGPPGGTLVVLGDREPDQLNPLTFTSLPAYQAVHLMFRALARRDSTLSNYQPDLAQSWHMEGDSTLILELRHDVMWDDGVKVTSEDVVYTIEKQRDPETASPRRPDVDAVMSVVARDSFTVAVKLKRTGLYMVNALLEVVPVPKHLLGGLKSTELRDAPFSRKPVGNGFYRFVSWTAGQRLLLEVNAAKPDGRASIDRIVIRFIPDINAAVTELLTGEGDLIPKLSPNLVRNIESSQNAKVYHGPRVRPAWLAWNTRKAPMNDAKVRRAILMAIDRPQITKALFGNVGEPSLSPIPSVLREHTPTVKPVPYDTAGARALLAEAGWRDTNGDNIVDKNGKPLRIEIDFISSDQVRRDVLVAIQSMLKNIGVAIEPRAYESSAWVARLKAGEYTGSFWGWGWGPGVAGPNAEAVFHTRSIPPNGANFAAYSNKRVDELIDSTLVVTDTARARVFWAEMEQILTDDAVYSPIYLDPELFAVHSRFRNVKFRGIEWNEDVPYWYIDAKDRLPRDRSK
jgi:peptide/nickel transport system substrate-binding protein